MWKFYEEISETYTIRKCFRHLSTLCVVKFASGCPFGDVPHVKSAYVTTRNFTKMLRIAVTFDALYSEKSANLSRNKKFLQRPLGGGARTD